MQDRGNDGHAIALGGPNLASNPILGAHPIGDRNVTTIALLFDDYTALIVRAESPLKSMRDVVERLRKDPGALSIGVGPALGGGAHTRRGGGPESRRRAHSRRAFRGLQIRGRGDDRRNVR